jgi:hypothetical protein
MAMGHGLWAALRHVESVFALGVIARGEAPKQSRCHSNQIATRLSRSR